jgi:hypothetical protein
MYYGRSMLHELDAREHDTYDASTHTYIPKPKEEKIPDSEKPDETISPPDPLEPAPGT